MSYITTTKFFNTGFLPPYSTKLRVQQGLSPQNYVNDCAYTKAGRASGLAGQPVRMYPTGVTPLPTYGLKRIPASCPCAQWVRPP